MKTLIESIDGVLAPEAAAAHLRSEPGLVLLRTAMFGALDARYSFLAARPFMVFRAHGADCELNWDDGTTSHLFGNPWDQLQELMSRYELLDDIDLPFPLGGCFGFWGYDLKDFVEPKLPHSTADDLDVPDCYAGFYSSLLVFDHRLGQTFIISTGLNADGTRSEEKARREITWWRCILAKTDEPLPDNAFGASAVRSNMSRQEYVNAVEKTLRYIRAGDIYQVNIAQRLTVDFQGRGWDFFLRLLEMSPAPFAAYIDGGDFELASSSPERFLRLSGAHVQTRPIKGTRPRDADPTRDAQLSYELQTSAKEMAELVMITDLLRNDLGRICEFGTVQCPELVRLERYTHVQHLVSTVEGRLRSEVTHLGALASCFPGGSISGAPKFRAIQIIDELETVARGPYTGALGYLGFNRESQFSIIIRTALVKEGRAHFHVGAGIVADSDPVAEYEETLAKARGFLASLNAPAAATITHAGVR